MKMNNGKNSSKESRDEITINRVIYGNYQIHTEVYEEGQENRKEEDLTQRRMKDNQSLSLGILRFESIQLWRQLWSVPGPVIPERELLVVTLQR